MLFGASDGNTHLSSSPLIQFRTKLDTPLRTRQDLASNALDILPTVWHAGDEDMEEAKPRRG